ncbi:MAG: mannitol dehydrogenase family protein [Betaproteobacteria bacterium]
MTALNLATLPALPPAVARPAYDVGAVGVGIVHLGLGAFHRAHQAVYTDALLARDPRWGICGASLKTPRAIAGLVAQDGLYSVLWKGGGATRVQVIGALREVRFAGDDRAAMVARMADPRVSVITLTVTEKGYCHDPASGALDFTHPDIVADLADPGRPVSAPGTLAAAIAARRDARSGALTIVCCDNLPHNGHTVEGLVRAFVQARDPSLLPWMDDHVTFPDTMVDRIVPATTAGDIAEASRLLGLADAAAVCAEPFGQWVIENRFAGPHPAWEDTGAQYASDVGVYETMKLRLLNGSHSAIAYLGFLMGHPTVWQASADPLLAPFVERMMRDEITPTLVPPPGVDLAGYCRELLVRFRNNALPHRTQQIAMDGSQKLPQRLLGTVRDRLREGAGYARIALSIAAWIRYASGRDEAGAPIDVADPMRATFARLAATHSDNHAALADAFIDLRPVFGDLADNPSFRASVRTATVALFRDGARATLAQLG